MSEENVHLVRRANDAFNRRDIDALLALVDAQVEFTPRLLELEGGDPYRGHDGVRSWWENWLAAVPDFNTEVEEVQDLGNVIVARTRIRGHGMASGASIDQTTWQAVEVRRKKAVRWRTFGSEAEALEAAGLAQ